MKYNYYSPSTAFSPRTFEDVNCSHSSSLTTLSRKTEHENHFQNACKGPSFGTEINQSWAWMLQCPLNAPHSKEIYTNLVLCAKWLHSMYKQFRPRGTRKRSRKVMAGLCRHLKTELGSPFFFSSSAQHNRTHQSCTSPTVKGTVPEHCSVRSLSRLLRNAPCFLAKEGHR